MIKLDETFWPEIEKEITACGWGFLAPTDSEMMTTSTKSCMPKWGILRDCMSVRPLVEATEAAPGL